MKLEDQISELADLDICLSQGITVDDLLLSFSREEYESAPFDLILLVYGMEVEEEPWGRYICDRAWNFDAEAIEDDGSYIHIVEQIHRITGQAKRLEELADRVDLDEGGVELSYVVDGVRKQFKPEVNGDWADMAVVEEVMKDLRGDGYDYYAIDDGQASVWYYLTPEQALALNDLGDNVFNLNRKPWWKFW